MKTTRLEGVRYWGEYQPDRHIDFNGFHWQSPAGGVLIDPMPLDEAQLEELRSLGGAKRGNITLRRRHLFSRPYAHQGVLSKSHGCCSNTRHLFFDTIK